MDKEVIQRIIRDGQQRPLPRLTRRELKLAFVPNMALTIAGVRRGGKTFRTYQLIAEIGKSVGSRENICRLQFNDNRLLSLKGEGLHAIDEAYYALFPQKRRREDVLFVFDEIHRLEGWEDYILCLLEEPTHRVVVTGSTAKLLRGEVASALRGKSYPVELWPFSFREFTRHYGVPEDTVSSDGRSHLAHALRRYLSQGSFPGLCDISPEQHRELLQTYWDTMVLRDVIEAHPEDNINIAAFNAFVRALMARVACPLTVARLARNLHDAGLRFSDATLYRYLEYLRGAFMLDTVEFYSPSERVRSRNYRKVYCVDWALADAIAPASGVDITRQFENLIYVELRRRGHDVSYFRTREGHEVDFIAVSRTGRGTEPQLIQVTYSLASPDVREREFRAIDRTCRHLGVSRATVVTFGEEETVEANGVTVAVVPAWRWLLSK